MAGYQTIEALRPILHRGPPASPVVDRLLIYKPRQRTSPSLDQVKVLIRLRASGMPIMAISAETGIRPSTVRRHTLHVPPPVGGWSDGSRKTRFSEKDLQKAQRMRRAGFTWPEIAEELNCHRITIRRVLGRDKRYRSGEAPLSRVVRAVRNATGVRGSDVRQTDSNGGKVTAEVARARHIVFWIAHRHLGMTQTEIARRLGGFHSKTVSRGCVLAERVAAKLRVQDDMAHGVVAGRLWRAEWPKASR
jgi:predicted transcriptional regulator